MELLNAYLPFVSAAVSYFFAFAVLRRYSVGRRPYSLIWGVGLIFYALGTTMEALNGLLGWNPTVFRIWYFSGAMMTAAWLGQGTVYLLARRWAAHLLMGLLLLISLAGLFLIQQAELDPTQAAAGQLSGQVIVGPTLSGGQTPLPRLITPITNIYGTVALVGGAIYSAWIFWRKRILQNRVIGNILIAVGALSPAWGGTLARLGQPAYLYASELIGAILMFSGFLWATQQEEKAAEGKPQPAQKLA
ncbi:MAG: hypothetical protein HYX86_02265 [Chloroflexi bacterium]|nr:hypothetical protein [Chloroflexota bacterium]